MIRVLIVDSNRTQAQLLTEALKRRGMFTSTHCRPTLSECLSAMETATADVVLLADGLVHDRDRLYAILRGIQSTHPNTATVVLLDQYDRELVVNTLRAGARGLFSTALMPFKSLCRCITSVYQGQYWTNTEQLRFVLDSLSIAPAWRVTNSRGQVVLTPREEQTVRLVIEGLTNRDIARELKVTENTIKKSLLRIYERIGVSNRVELVLYALSHWQARSERSLPAEPPI